MSPPRRVILGTALASAVLFASTPVFAQAATSTTPAATAPTTSPVLGTHGEWISLAQAHDKLAAAGYEGVYKVEREKYGYKAKMRDSQGRKLEIYMEPLTGQVINIRVDD